MWPAQVSSFREHAHKEVPMKGLSTLKGEKTMLPACHPQQDSILAALQYSTLKGSLSLQKVPEGGHRQGTVRGLHRLRSVQRHTPRGSQAMAVVNTTLSSSGQAILRIQHIRLLPVSLTQIVQHFLSTTGMGKHWVIVSWLFFKT